MYEYMTMENVIELDGNQQTVKLSEQYIEHLEVLRSTLTKKQQIDGA